MRAATVIALVGLCFGAVSAAAGASATLRLQDRTPIVVTGVGFQRGERVQLTLVQPRSSKRIVRANRHGAFSVAFQGATAGRCDLVRVVAVGSGGGRTVLKILPSPACWVDRSP